MTLIIVNPLLLYPVIVTVANFSESLKVLASVCTEIRQLIYHLRPKLPVYLLDRSRIKKLPEYMMPRLVVSRERTSHASYNKVDKRLTFYSVKEDNKVIVGNLFKITDGVIIQMLDENAEFSLSARSLYNDFTNYLKQRAYPASQLRIILDCILEEVAERMSHYFDVRVLPIYKE